MLRKTAVLLVCVCAVGPAYAQTAQNGRGAQARPAVTVPSDIEIVRADGKRSRFSIEAIKKATTGPIDRNGQQTDFTPLTAVMKAAEIPASAKLRVTAAADRNEMILQHGAKMPVYDTDHFGFIFNQEGLPVLTPKPGTPPAAPPVVSDRPQVRGVVKIEVLAR